MKTKGGVQTLGDGVTEGFEIIYVGAGAEFLPPGRAVSTLNCSVISSSPQMLLYCVSMFNTCALFINRRFFSLKKKGTFFSLNIHAQLRKANISNGETSRVSGEQRPERLKSLWVSCYIPRCKCILQFLFFPIPR